MFGTGECASSARESTRPSCTSSSWRSGTYCRQIGSPGDVMSSTMAGEMRNSKFSAACRSRSRSGKCSAPNRATSASREATLRLRRSSCQDSIAQVLEVDHQVVSGGVITREPGGRRVAAPLVERAGGRVFGAGRCLDDNQSSVVSRQSLLHGPQERAPHALALPRGVHDDPVEVVGAGGAGGRTTGTYDLYWIVVDPAWQGKGVGSALLRAVEERLPTDNGRLIVVETSSRAEYAPTRAFYERRGYAPAARLPGYYARGDDLVIYLKDLSDGVLARAPA